MATKKRLTKKQKARLIWRFTLLKRVGEGLILLGLVVSAAPFWPIIQAETNYVINPPKLEAPSAQEFPQDLFKIIIPKIGVEAPIIADVDSTNYPEYIKALKLGVAHAKETAKPGQPFGVNQNTFLFAHSTLYLTDVPKYNAIFIFLRKLEKGDEIDLIYEGKLAKYEVTEKKVVEATDLRYLTEFSAEPLLTLQTCDPPGTNLRRLIIQAKPV